MRRAFRIVQFGSNIAIIIIAFLLGFVVIKQSLFDPAPRTNYSPSRPAQENLVGKTLPLENVNWKENKKTLVIYLSTTCRYCTESSPFYRELVEEYSSDGTKIIAVLPQPVEEAKEYLKSNGVNIIQVYSTSLSSIGLRSTPTLMLVNEEGVISHYWRGKLSENKEAEVLQKLSAG